MRRILIVEDEALLRQGLLFLGPWESRGYEIVAAVGSGEEALSLIRMEAPDLVLCDIVMPGMDGITLLREIHGRWPELPVVMLTNYDEFTYVRQALKAGVADYLLKNEAGFDSLVASLDRVLAQDPAAGKGHGKQRQKDRQFFMHRLLLDERLDEDALAALWAETGTLEALPCRLVVLGARALPGETQREPTFWAWLEDTLPEDTLFLSRGDHGVLLCPATRAAETIRRAQAYGLQWHLDLCALFGPATERLSAIQGQYALAQRQRALWFYDEENPVLELQEGFSFAPLPELDRGRVEACLALGDRSGLVSLLEGQFALAARPGRYGDPAELLRWCEELVHTAMRHPGGPGDDMERTRRMLVFFRQIAGIQRSHELEESVRAFLLSLGEGVDAEGEEESASIPAILAYIRHHYREDLSLRSVAERFHRNYHALSKAFAAQVGMGMLEYLTRLRMREAAALLSGTQASVNEVATQVGYPDPGYFSRAFRKRYGVSPKQYRDDHRGVSDEK